MGSMVHSKGYRSGTREKYSKGFRQAGIPLPAKRAPVIKIGDYVDIVVDSAVHKGMPYHYYHGRTGRVFGVYANAVGVIVKKVVGNREILKRLLVNIAHVKPNRSRQEFLKRCVKNQELQLAAKQSGTKVSTKRVPELPTDSEHLTPSKVYDITMPAYTRVFL